MGVAFDGFTGLVSRKPRPLQPGLPLFGDRARPWVYLLLFGTLLAAGCSTSNENSGLNLVDSQGRHPAGWLAAFPGPSLHSRTATLAFISGGTTNCTECHGADLRGGISRVSCLTSACHHNSAVTNWWNPTVPPGVHGAFAKKAPGSSSFFSCRICHGNGFDGGLSGVSCFPCHGDIHPHPEPPWRIFGVTDNTHTNTNVANAPVCAACHFPQSPNNPANHPANPAPAGTPPGCFNSTLCHGPDTTPHILGATWRDPTSAAFHGLAAKQDLLFCQSCHGTPGTIQFNGGVAPTACSACHATARAHPTNWYQLPVATFPGYVPSHRNALNQPSACSICHDFTQGRTPPDPAAPSCFSASYSNTEHASVTCHATGPGAPNHQVPFLDPVHLGVNTAGFNADCANCHTISGASPVVSAPACQVCHTLASPVAPGGNFGICGSCHGSASFPPFPNSQPNGTTYPNIAGAHAQHIALDNAFLPGSNLVDCDTCHDGLGFVTLAHYTRANARPGFNALRIPPGDVAFLGAYDAKSGPSSFDNVALTCTNVSCHGGSANLNWQTGTLNVNTQCASCHALGTAQFNSYNSGQHNFHVNVEALACTECHSTTKLADPAVGRHFANLATPALDTRASVTISGTDTSIPEGNYVAGATVGTGTCTPNCHGTLSW